MTSRIALRSRRANLEGAHQIFSAIRSGADESADATTPVVAMELVMLTISWNNGVRNLIPLINYKRLAMPVWESL